MHINKKVFKNLLQGQKKQIIDKLRNFPRLPELGTICNRNQIEVLQQNFPWGFNQIHRRVRFSEHDSCWSLSLDMSNICIGIKYGICPIYNQQLLVKITKIFKNNKGATYIKLLNQSGPTHKKLIALVSITKINPSITFRFWHTPSKNHYPIGVVLIQVIAVGQIEYRQSDNLQYLYNQLKSSSLDWKHFIAADDLEQNQRRKYITAIQNDKCQEFQTELEKKNLSILDLLDETESSKRN